jgi:hypothetical protein
MSTVQETLIPASMVPGLVTVELKDGTKKNLYPVDAKEIIANGDAKLVENGAIEASRMAATPLRSGYASGIPADQIIAEVAGVEGRIVAASTAEEAEEVIEAGNSADANREPSAVPATGYDAMRDASVTPPAEDADRVERKGAAKAAADSRGGVGGAGSGNVGGPGGPGKADAGKDNDKR